MFCHLSRLYECADYRMVSGPSTEIYTSTLVIHFPVTQWKESPVEGVSGARAEVVLRTGVYSHTFTHFHILSHTFTHFLSNVM